MPYPQPLCSYSIETDSPHKLAVKEYGSEDGYPVVFLHGGPGSGCRIGLCDLFDLERFRVIAPDQRGAGGSTPKGCLEKNETRYLVEDIELIRNSLAIEKWMVVGGSWGALLAIAYAENYPSAVTGIVLRSLFLGDDDEIQRAFIDLPKTFYPELHEIFIGLLPEDERQDPLQAYYKRILDDDPSVSHPAIFVWHDYERAMSVLQLPVSTDRILPSELSLDVIGKRDQMPATPRMEAHYFSNHCFLSPGLLLKKADCLHNIPGIIVQARYDLLCPPQTAHSLARRWPYSRVVTVEKAGHSQSEAGITEATRRAVAALVS